MTNTFPDFFLINTSDIKQYSRIFTKTQIAKGTNAIQFNIRAFFSLQVLLQKMMKQFLFIYPSVIRLL